MTRDRGWGYRRLLVGIVLVNHGNFAGLGEKKDRFAFRNVLYIILIAPWDEECGAWCYYT
jgi:hypothetical protein